MDNVIISYVRNFLHNNEHVCVVLFELVFTFDYTENN